MKRRIAIALGVLAAIGGLMAGLATAHNVVFPNKVTLTKAVPKPNNRALFKGRVKSPKARCERKREVQIFNATANPDVRLARTSTVRSRYKVKGNRPSPGDNVYALIETLVVVGNQNHSHVCAVDRSPNVTYPHK